MWLLATYSPIEPLSPAAASLRGVLDVCVQSVCVSECVFQTTSRISVELSPLDPFQLPVNWFWSRAAA